MEKTLFSKKLFFSLHAVSVDIGFAVQQQFADGHDIQPFFLAGGDDAWQRLCRMLAIVVDQLLSALSRQKITLPSEEKNQMIVYAESKIAEAVEKAKELRAQGISVSLIQMQEGRSKDDYLSYAMKDHVSKVEFIEEA